MFRNDGGKRFQDVTTSGGFGHLQKGHGISFADLDLDGDQDIYQVMGGALSGDTYRNVLYENPGHGNNWIKIKLVGERSNRPGLGAKLKLTIHEAGRERTLYRTVSSGGSFGASPLRQEIGLGQATRVEQLEILWPGTGSGQSFTNLPVNALLTITEDRPEYQTTQQKPAPLRRSPAPHHH
jgi:hypothetical protein